MAPGSVHVSNIDAVLQQALAHHQTGHLSEAEKLYRQVLALRPDFAEVHVNLGIALVFQGKLEEAASAYRQGLIFKSDYAKWHYQLGDVLALQGKMDEAIVSYRRALALKPNHAETHNNLGNALMCEGKLDEAESSYRRALAIKPSLAEAYNNIGSILLQRGNADEAETAFQQALTVRPDYAEAHNNLGNTLAIKGKLDAAMVAFQRAVAARPDYAEAHNNLGATFTSQGRLNEAVTSYRQALALKPDHVEAYNNLGNALKGQGKLVEAEAAYRQAIILKPYDAVAYNHLAMILCEYNRIEEGLALHMRHAELAYGATNHAPSSVAALPHKIKHDQEQQTYLAGLKTDDGAVISGALRLADGNRILGPTVNLKNTIGEIENQWRQNQPQIVVIDNLLTDEALHKLQRFCWGSTIWRKVYNEGYLGALPEHGFACPLLAQIANELRSAYPTIFREHPLLQLWAFKYDSTLRGINLHADFAAVNVNFWITPDDANLNPESGGLVIWNVAAPLDWNIEKYNRKEKDIRDFLTRTKAQSVTIPYRANRAVIFDSDLFHETDKFVFNDGYLNRRINVTLLYGRRETVDRSNSER